MKYGYRALALSCALVTAWLTAPALAQLPTAQLASVFPSGGKAGTTFDITLSGADLDDLERLVFSHVGITAAQKMSSPTELQPTPKKLDGQFTVTIAGDVPVGNYELRTIGRFGMSNPRTFVVGMLNEVLDAGGNNALDKAVDVPIGTTFNGRVDQNSYEYLRVPLKGGERVLIDVAAQRIDSKLDATLVVLDPGGSEVARIRKGAGDDPVLDFTAPAEGAYLLKLYDNVYGGGSDYFYRASVQSAAFVDFVFPPSGPAGSTNQYTLFGRNLPGGQPAEGLSIGNVPLMKLQVAIPLPGDDASKVGLALAGLSPLRQAFQDGIEYRLVTPQGPANPVNVYYSRSPNVVIEQEPNNDPHTPHKITLPCEYVGQFYPERDADWVQFEAKRGEVYFLEVISSQLGLESDPYLALFRVTKNEQGEEQLADIAQVDDPPRRNERIGGNFDTTSDDPSYKFNVPEDGTYRALVRDQFGDGRRDPSMVYRLAIRPAEPDFRLVAYPDAPQTEQQQNQLPMVSVDLAKGGTAALGVAVDRQGDFAGEISITLEGLPGGVSCAGAVLGGNVETAALVLMAEENAAAFVGPLKIVGRARIGDRDVIREARYGAVIWGTQNRQQEPGIFRLIPRLQLAVLDKTVAPATVRVGEDKVYETSLGGNLEFPVNITRRGEFKESIKFVAAGLPQQIKPKDLNLDANTASGKLELQVNRQDIPPGTYTFYMKGETKRNFVRNPDAIAAAEAEQKEVTETIVKLQAAVTAANTAKDTTTRTAQEAANAVKQAEQKKNEATNNAKAKADIAKQAADKLTQAKEAAAKDAANQALADAVKAAETASSEAATAQKQADEDLAAADKALVDAQAKAKTDEEARVKAEADLKTAQDKVAQANQLKQQIDQRVNQVKQQNQAKDYQFALASTPVKLKIEPSPIKLAPLTALPPLKQEAKQELVVKFDRLYGFAEQVELRLEPPQGVPGINVQQVNVPNGQGEGKLEIAAGGNAPVGQHACTLKARARFNNVQVESAAPVVVSIEAKAEAK